MRELTTLEEDLGLGETVDFSLDSDCDSCAVRAPLIKTIVTVYSTGVFTSVCWDYLS